MFEKKLTRISLLLSAGLLASACGGEGNPTEAQTDDEIIQFNFCTAGAADATLTMGAGVDVRSTSSPDASYAQSSLCSRFKVDVVVPHSSSPTTNNRSRSVTVWTDILGIHPDAYGEAYCETMRETVSIYAKTVDVAIGGGTPPSFSFLKSISLHGVWTNPGDFGGGCALESTDPEVFSYWDGAAAMIVFDALPPSGLTTTTTYRFAISGKIDDVYRRMKLVAMHREIPQ